MANRGAVVASAQARAKIARLTQAASSGKEGAMAATKKVKTDGLNVSCVIWGVSRKESNEKAPTNIIVYVKPFTKKIVEGLDERYYQFDEKTGIVKVAIQRYITQEEGLKGVKLEDSYPKGPLNWVEIRPGALIKLSDFNHGLNASHAFMRAKIFDLKPRYKKPGSKNSAGQVSDELWGWRWYDKIKVDPNFKPLNFRALSYLADSFPPEMFFFEDQRFPNTEQGSVMIKVFPSWDIAGMSEELKKDPNIISTWVVMDDSVTSWSISPKIPNVKSCVLPKPQGGRDKDSYTVKALLGHLTAIQTLAGKEQQVIIKVSLGTAVIEEAFCVKDLSLWYYRMRYIAPFLPFMALCNIGDKGTKSMILNVNGRDQAGKWRDPNTEEAKAVTDEALEAKPDPAAAAAAAAGDAQDHEAVEDEAAKAAAFREMMKRRAQTKRDQGGAKTVDIRADFGAAVYCDRLLFDASDAYARYLIPVPATWPMSLVKVGKENLPQPYDRVDVSQKGDFEVFDDKAALNLNNPNSLPAVVCVSDYTPDEGDLVDKFVALAKKGYGTFHVAVNSKTYANPDAALSLFSAIEVMTPEEGEVLLEKGSVLAGKNTASPVQVSLEMEPIDKGRLYVLFYRNKSKVSSTLKKDIEEALRAHRELPEGSAAPPPAASAVAANPHNSPPAGPPVLQLTHEPSGGADSILPAAVVSHKQDVVMESTSVTLLKRPAGQVEELASGGEEKSLADEPSVEGGGKRSKKERSKEKKEKKKKSGKHEEQD
jgi:hypothetical protein